MAKIIPKLNLNRTPAIVDSNSLIFAKNIRLDVDGSLHKDYNINRLFIGEEKRTIFNDIYDSLKNQFDNNNYETFKDVYENVISKLDSIKYYFHGFVIFNAKILSIISSSSDFYILIAGLKYDYTTNQATNEVINSFIIKYSEKNNSYYPCDCNWNCYSSESSITGNVINNLYGETILNISESHIDTFIPFKSINLNNSSVNDDESIYTQSPNIPLINLAYIDNFSFTIPNGVYQFFIRYRIRDNFYTNWFPASKEIFVGNQNNITTSFGSIKYTNIHKDSENSIIFSVEILENNYVRNYKDFQIGFILSHDDTIYGREWKHFSFDTNYINFDYNSNDAQECEISDFFKITYNIYNIRNITSYKNKLYISNYIESDFNENLEEYAENVKITYKSKTGNSSYDNYPVITNNIGANDCIYGLIVNNNNININEENGIIHKLFTKDGDSYNFRIATLINDALSSNDDNINKCNGVSIIDLYGISAIVNIKSLKAAKDKIRTQYRNISTNTRDEKYELTFLNDSLYSVYVNNYNSNSSIRDKLISKPNLLTKILKEIYDFGRYINIDNFRFVDKYNNISDTIRIKIKRRCNVKSKLCIWGNIFTPSINDNLDIEEYSINNNYGWNCTEKEFVTEYDQEIIINLNASSSKYITNDASNLINFTTLIPYQYYKFYIHFVKNTGEITNGYYCNGKDAGEQQVNYKYDANSIIYPEFSNIEIPNNYCACFFSIVKSKQRSATIFDIKKADNTLEGSCIELNTLLFSGSKKLNIYQNKENLSKDPSDEFEEVETTDNLISKLEINNDVNTDDKRNNDIYKVGKYYYSSDISIPKYFGANGVVVIDSNLNTTNDNIKEGNYAYLVENYENIEIEKLELVKCTPYINEYNSKCSLVKNDTDTNKKRVLEYSDYSNMNLLGYICKVCNLDRDKCCKYYSDGSSIYYKLNLNANNENLNINLKELSKYNDGTYKLCDFKTVTTNNIYIYSNYNLNYLSLSEEPKYVIKTYYNRNANDTVGTSESNEDNSNSIMLILFSSQLLSNLYELPSMYKDYVRKTFSVYTDTDRKEFNNTIRSSILYGNENKINNFIFDSEDYYNIPTDKGIIINLISIGNGILIHTEHSMYKFSGNNTLQSSEGEIQQTENNIFDTGVTEIFGTDFGIAGLQNKNHYVLTNDSYIFFDSNAKIIYSYNGQGKLIKISDSIEKLFRYGNITNMSFANDYNNNRIFICITFNKNDIEHIVTLSYNVKEEINSFVSLHDFYFSKSVNTKDKCYFYEKDNIYVIDTKKSNADYTYLFFTDKLYPNIIYNSIIDIIVNDDYENIKTLNSISWSGNKILKEISAIDNDDISSLRLAEDSEIDINSPCKYIRIYTDTCISDLLDCDNKSNNYSISNTQSYTLPRYNQGLWSLNYFRNILNSNDNNTKNNYFSDNNSLIEGKYFVIRFVFDSDFKLETLKLNYSNKI